MSAVPRSSRQGRGDRMEPGCGMRDAGCGSSRQREDAAAGQGVRFGCSLRKFPPPPPPAVCAIPHTKQTHFTSVTGNDMNVAGGETLLFSLFQRT